MKKALLTTLVVALASTALFASAEYAGYDTEPPPKVYRAKITQAWITGIAAGQTEQVKWIRWQWAYGPGVLPTTVTITEIRKDGISILWTPQTVPGSTTSKWCPVHYNGVPGTGAYSVTFDAAWGTGASAVHKTYTLHYALLT